MQKYEVLIPISFRGVLRSYLPGQTVTCMDSALASELVASGHLRPVLEAPAKVRRGAK